MGRHLNLYCPDKRTRHVTRFLTQTRVSSFRRLGRSGDSSSRETRRPGRRGSGMAGEEGGRSDPDGSPLRLRSTLLFVSQNVWFRPNPTRPTPPHSGTILCLSSVFRTYNLSVPDLVPDLGPLVLEKNGKPNRTQVLGLRVFDLPRNTSLGGLSNSGNFFSNDSCSSRRDTTPDLRPNR